MCIILFLFQTSSYCFLPVLGPVCIVLYPFQNLVCIVLYPFQNLVCIVFYPFHNLPVCIVLYPFQNLVCIVLYPFQNLSVLSCVNLSASVSDSVSIVLSPFHCFRLSGLSSTHFRPYLHCPFPISDPVSIVLFLFQTLLALSSSCFRPWQHCPLPSSDPDSIVLFLF